MDTCSDAESSSESKSETERESTDAYNDYDRITSPHTPLTLTSTENIYNSAD